MAELRRTGREFFHWAISNAPVDATDWEASIAGTWHDMTRDGDVISIQIEGPDVAPDDRDPTAVILPASERIEIRLKDTPEIVIRDPGWVSLT